MNHEQYRQTVKEYSQKTGHVANYYDAGYSSTDTGRVGKKTVHKGSLAKDKMTKLLAKSDSKSNPSSKHKNVTTLINDL